jgi:hypothetical protein
MYYIVNDNNSILHSNGVFYCCAMSGYGLQPSLYKRKGNAERKCAEMQKKYPQWNLRVVETHKRYK